MRWQNEPLLVDMFTNQAFVAAVYLNGFEKDAMLLWTFGRAMESSDRRGLTQAYREQSWDRAERLVHVLFGDNMWRVGRSGGGASPLPLSSHLHAHIAAPRQTSRQLRARGRGRAGKQYGLAAGHVRGFPRDTLLALTQNWSAQRQLACDTRRLIVTRALTQVRPHSHHGRGGEGGGLTILVL